MFGHLKAEEFVKLYEGLELPHKRHAHLRLCVTCNQTWSSMKSLQNEFSALESDILEPDWDEFRSSVRDQLLSRSVQRTSAFRRWTGWPMRPATAWSLLSILLVVSGTIMAVLWRAEPTPSIQGTSVVEQMIGEAAAEQSFQFSGIDSEMNVWSRTSAFDESFLLEDSERAQFREMLQLALGGDSSSQNQ